jgi:hypothetical protein
MEAFCADLAETLNRHKNTNNGILNNLISNIGEMTDHFVKWRQIDDDILDFDTDDEGDAYEEEEISGNRDPTHSKYPLETMMKIADLHRQGKTYASIRRRYKKLTSDIEVTRLGLGRGCFTKGILFSKDP